MDLVKLLGENVRRLRIERGLSQEALALNADMKRSYLSELENGKRNPSVRAMGRLAEALSVEPFILVKVNRIEME